jgi:hypothetical protein
MNYALGERFLGPDRDRLDLVQALPDEFGVATAHAR